MTIKPWTEYVDQSGRLYLPYLSDWKANISDLLGVIQVMICVFEKTFPLEHTIGSHIITTTFERVSSPEPTETPNNNMHQMVANNNIPPRKSSMTMESQYMQQQSQIFVFNTKVANDAADAVDKESVASIIDYHCANPDINKCGNWWSNNRNIVWFTPNAGYNWSAQQQQMFAQNSDIITNSPIGANIRSCPPFRSNNFGPNPLMFNNSSNPGMGGPTHGGPSQPPQEIPDETLTEEQRQKWVKKLALLRLMQQQLCPEMMDPSLPLQQNDVPLMGPTVATNCSSPFICNKQEPALMPVPSPQQIQYLNTFEGQELTIQKQPNTSLKNTDLTAHGSDLDIGFNIVIENSCQTEQHLQNPNMSGNQFEMSARFMTPPDNNQRVGPLTPVSPNIDNSRYTLIERKEMVELYYQTNSYKMATKLFAQKYPERKNISRCSVRLAVKLFTESGELKNKKRIYQRPATNDSIATNILASYILNGKKERSARKMGGPFGISRESVRQILVENQFHPYKAQTVHVMNGESDYKQREDFAKWVKQELKKDPNFVKRILFCDEAIFYAKGHINRQNQRWWSPHNPHWIEEIKTPSDDRVMVWCGIWGNRIIGPHYFENTVTGHSFTEMMETKVLPEIRSLPGYENMIFLCDGASAYYSVKCREFLDREFPNRWIGRIPNGQTKSLALFRWPPRSPDITICDFFLWGALKGWVYNIEVNTRADIIYSINLHVKLITTQMLINARKSFGKRMDLLLKTGGKHIEHIYNCDI